MDLTSFFDALWADFVEIAPNAAAIRGQLEALGETIDNDHVAFRTFDIAPVNISALEPVLLELGYRRFEPYVFPAKKLRAYSYVHDSGPRIFLSELLTERFSTEFQAIVHGLVKQTPADFAADASCLYAGTPWDTIDWGSYLRLREESEYAAWLAVFGFRANHFTVSVTDLQKLTTVSEVLDFVESKGYGINASGGRVKGGPAELLEQGSTLADQVEMTFANGDVHTIPSCYYEFAKRFATDSGALYEGFVSSSADKIFESTDARFMAS